MGTQQQDEKKSTFQDVITDKAADLMVAVSSSMEQAKSGNMQLPFMLRIGSAVCSILLIISIYLPFVSVSFWGFTETAKLSDGSDGVIFFILGVVALFLSVVLGRAYIARAVTMWIGVFAVIMIPIYQSQLTEKIAGSGFSQYVEQHSGFGMVLLLLAGIGMVACSAVSIVKEYGYGALLKKPKKQD